MVSSVSLLTHFVLKAKSALRRKFRYKSRLVVRLLGLGSRKAWTSFGLNGLDLEIFKAISTKSKYYVELGANDGVSQSNTLALELFAGWRGLLIEPVPEVYWRLKENRNSRRNSLVNAACVARGFRGDSVEMLYSNLMSVTLGMDLDISDPISHARDGERFLGDEGKIRRLRVPAITLTDALVSAGSPRKIGLLSLDVEGAELDVLKGIDFERHIFEWIAIESRDLERIVRFLEPQGYLFVKTLSEHKVGGEADYLFRFSERGNNT
jgi:FkbM family methyltransferase